MTHKRIIWTVTKLFALHYLRSTSNRIQFTSDDGIRAEADRNDYPEAMLGDKYVFGNGRMFVPFVPKKVIEVEI